jgi:tellurite resistance protein
VALFRRNRGAQPPPKHGTPPPDPRTSLTSPAPSSLPAPPAYRRQRTWSGDAQWVPAGGTVRIAGHDVHGGMVWVGSSMAHQYGREDPALINPTLPVDVAHPDWAATEVDYWSSYTDLTAQQRSAFLAWLAHGRRAPGVAISYVFLFLYGLERRVLDLLNPDSQPTPADVAELVQIRTELAGLRATYAVPTASDYPANSFDRYCGALVDLIDSVLAATQPRLPPLPDYVARTWEVPLTMKVALSRIAASDHAIPAEWALAWAWVHPNVYTRTPQRRCRDEFDALFRARYAARHGDGLRIQPGSDPITLEYHGASATAGSIRIVLSLADVSDQAQPVQALSVLVEECNNDLDSYSRWVGRHPGDHTSLAAVSMLPVELLDPAEGSPLADLLTWARSVLRDGETAVTDPGQLLRLWGAEKPSKAQSVAIGNMLQKLGFGMEPDVRCGGPVLGSEPMVLFRAKPDTPHTAGPAYAAATLVAHLGVVVAAADGHVDDSEVQQIVRHLDMTLTLSPGERGRLQAHVAWLGAAGVKMTGLKRRLEPLTMAERVTLADFVATVAAADGVIDPAESRTVCKIHILLDLDPATAAGRLHAAMTGIVASGTGSPAATQPVTVRAGSAPKPGHSIPAPEPVITTPVLPTGGQYVGRYGDTGPEDHKASGFSLDAELIAARRADTERVSALLTRILEDTDTDTDTGVDDGASMGLSGRQTSDPPSPAAPPTESPVTQPEHANSTPLVNLDAAHRALLDALTERTSWYRVEIDRLAHALRLEPAVALEALNDASRAVSNTPLITGAERLTINVDALTALTAAVQPTDPVPEPAATQEPPPTAHLGGPRSAANATERPADERGAPRIQGLYAGLDGAHSALLEALAAQSAWFRIQFEALANDQGLLPDAAFERLNDAALDACDDLLLDGGERLTVNKYALTEMLG